MPIYKLSSNALGSFLNITLANVNANTATVSTVTSNNLITSLITVNSITSSNVTVTGYLIAPVGDTSQRPAVPSNGMFRYNTTTGGFEGYKGSWGSLGGESSVSNVQQVVSTNFNTQLSYGSGDGSGQSLGNSTFSVIPSATYVNITSRLANSKFLIIANGNLSASNDSALADWIGAYGIVVDPAGGTSWTRIGSGLQGGSSNPNNKKFFASRASPSTTGNDSYYVMPMSINYMYSSNVAAGVTLRFAIEYFHYYGATHTTLYINRTPQNDTTNAYSYTGGLATTITVMELAS